MSESLPETSPLMLREVVSSLKPAAANWNGWILICDGSGTTHDKACGWHGLLFRNLDDVSPYSISGGNSYGTNNFAELSPIVAALWKLRNLNSKEKVRLLVITDSEWVVKCFEGEYRVDWDGANVLLWESIYGAVDIWNYEIEMRCVKRNSNAYNTLCDTKAKENRAKFSSPQGIK